MARTERGPVTRLRRGLFMVGLGGGLVSQASAAVLTVGSVPGVAVPDADPSGRALTLNVPDTGWRITDVNVTLSLSGNPATFGGWNGDLYAWLGHNGALAVLLGRVGRTGADAFGYADSGFSSVVLDDEAAHDVHFYQDTLGLAPGSLAGHWQPDARSTDPEDPFDPDPLARDAFLDGFRGLDPRGEWVLFLADLSAGGELVLDAWQLELTVQPVPEPQGATLAGGALLAGLVAWRWRQRGRVAPAA